MAVRLRPRSVSLPAGTVSSRAAADDGISLPRESQWVVFVCEARRFGFPLEQVSEILTPLPFTRLPGTGPEVCGLVGVHGRVVAVVDLGIVLGLRAAATYGDYRLLLLDVGTRQVGAVVEEVAAITLARVERRGPVDEEGPVLGIAHIDEGEFTALEPARLLRQLIPT
jgi:chemotaxis signal transduction protein